MKVVVFSDSHKMPMNMIRVISAQQSTSDLFIHLGDGTSEFLNIMEKFGEKRFCCVAGNHEERLAASLSDPAAPDYRILELCGYRILITHGHRQTVKAGYDRLTAFAREKEADAVIFGHTHQPENKYLPPDSDNAKGLYIFNPGSISLPLYGIRSQYGVIEIFENKGMLFSNITCDL